MKQINIMMCVLMGLVTATASAITTTANPFETGTTSSPERTTQTQRPQSRQPTGGSDCSNMPRTCGQMTSCAQAQKALQCGNTRLDRDKDGVPCESICGGG